MDNFPPVDPFRGSSSDVPDNNVAGNDPMLIFYQNPNVGLQGLPLIAEPPPSNALIPQAEVGEDVGISDLLNYDPRSDSYAWHMINETFGNVGVSGSSAGIIGESVPQENLLEHNISQISGFGNPRQLSVWPVPPSPYDCSCCHVLREINHVNGKHFKILEIHGRTGLISHAVLDKYDFDDISSENHEYLIFDFYDSSIVEVRNFLIQYFEDCRREGYTVLPDPLSNFYQTLCVGLNVNAGFDSCSSLQSSPMGSGDIHSSQQDTESEEVRLPKSKGKEIASQSEAESKGSGQERSFIAAQRERTGKLKLEDFAEYFHLPINEAAKMMNVCPTVIKKKCRQGGLPRWPHRKIKGIKRLIVKKKEELRKGAAEEQVRLLAEIQMLEEELTKIFEKRSE